MTKAKVLLIEDDPAFHNSIQLMLRNKNIEVAWAATGTDGIKAYRAGCYGFATVIIDYCLPYIRGSEVAKQVRKMYPGR